MSGFEGLVAALDELRTFFEARSWSHCLIGGLAANRWGEVRHTRDIDLVVLAEIGDESDVIDEMLKVFPLRAGRFGSKAKGKSFALQSRVLLLQTKAGVPIDVALGATGFEAEMLNRAKLVAIASNHKFRTASPEDIIVMKTIAGRAHDWRDIEGIIVRQGSQLDWAYIERWLDPLLEIMELPERSEELKTLRVRLDAERGPTSRKVSATPPKKRSQTKRRPPV